MRKNIMRTPEEKENIVKEYRNTPITLRAIAEKYNTSTHCIHEWVNKYEKNGIKALESETGKTKGNGRPKKANSREEELERKIMKLEIDIARLKKGYLVKGVGAEKEFVTTFDKNMK